MAVDLSHQGKRAKWKECGIKGRKSHLDIRGAIDFSNKSRVACVKENEWDMKKCVEYKQNQSVKTNCFCNIIHI